MLASSISSDLQCTSLRGPGGGVYRLAATEFGLLCLALPGRSKQAFDAEVARLAALPARSSRAAAEPAGVEDFAALLRCWSADTAWQCFWFPPRLDLRGSAFHRRCWERLRALEPGRTVTYGELAARVGSPRAARAAGTAMRSNPTPLFVPCHRVLATTGLGGFGAAGLGLKRHLLELEGAAL